LREFDDFCFENQVLTLTKDACNFAAEIYSQRRRASLESYKVGLDILIAGIALAKGYAIVTENTQDFSDIDGLVVYNWLQP
jgi:predicted nucleic acid-binding protein